MDVNKMWEHAEKEAKRLSELLPIIQGIRDNTKEAFDLIMSQQKTIRGQDLVIKELQKKLNE